MFGKGDRGVHGSQKRNTLAPLYTKYIKDNNYVAEINAIAGNDWKRKNIWKPRNRIRRQSEGTHKNYEFHQAYILR